MQTLVFDTAAVLNFGHRGELTFLLQKLSQEYKLVTTPGVVDELTDPAKKDFYETFLFAHFEIQSAAAGAFDLTTLACLSQTIDPGEITAMALARELQAIAVLDDRAARREATRLNITFTGTVGLLKEAVDRAWITEADSLRTLHKLCDRKFKIPRPEPGQSFADYLTRL